MKMFRDIVRKHQLDGLGSCACAAPSVGVGGWGRGGGTYYLVRLESLSTSASAARISKPQALRVGGRGSSKKIGIVAQRRGNDVRQTRVGKHL